MIDLRRRAVVVALVLATTVIAGCVFSQHREARASREAYHACLDDPDRTEEDCEALRVEAERDWDEYESEAQRQWGCENSTQGCRTPPNPPDNPHATHPY